jgi:ribonuclease G
MGEELAGGELLHGGLIVRTAGENQSSEEFDSDATYLAGLWAAIQRRAAGQPAPALLHAEVGAVAKVLRDVFHRDVKQVTVNTVEVHREAVEFLERTQPNLIPRVHVNADDVSPFEKHGVNAQLERALRPRVWLKSGGHIVINQTEALVAIDVNTGKYVGKTRLEETILRTNLEAVREIVRQVRLRDLGGIIVVDFIDMEQVESKQEVIEALREELKKDRSKSRMLQISEFGLVEITRQRTKPSLERLLCVSCPTCGGAGRVKSADTVYFEIVREARKLVGGGGRGALRIRVHPLLLEPLGDRRNALAAELGLNEGDAIALEADADLRPHQWSLALL